MAELHDKDPQRPPRPAVHHHLWSAADGTGLHAPPGKLAVDRATGDLCCHVCGVFFQSLGGHVRVHGYTATEYRWAMGLGRTTALTSRALSSAISRRQSTRFETSDDHRRNLEAGRAMVRDHRPTTGLHRVDRDPRPETVAKQTATLDQGRATVAARREWNLRRRLDALGVDDLADWLRSEYAHGASIDGLARSLGIGRGRVRDELIAAGIAIRHAGSNSVAGKQSRAAANDMRATRRLGVDDVRDWLMEQRRDGATLSELSAVVGHSAPWVRDRIESR